jgi:aminoglycoside phosphotransferase (APT) family kinase protein
MTHMILPEKPLEQIADALIAYLRVELDAPAIRYDTPLTQMEGGYETYTYRFRPGGVSGELAQTLVLRIYPQLYGTDRAVWESTIQNALADVGYPAPRAYLTCTDTSVLGGAFFIMQFLPGELMITAPPESIPGMLGRTHAALHDIDPEPLLQSLREQGFNESRYNLGGRLDWLRIGASKHPWLGDGVDWLLTNRPPEPERISMCHGDFHPLNILVQDGEVTGVLDWPGFIVTDPLFDVANTIILTMISAKHILSLTEWEIVIGMYLDAYRAQRPLDLKHLDYYKARRCIVALMEGADGHNVWQNPLIVRDLTACVHSVAGIRITRTTT